MEQILTKYDPFILRGGEIVYWKEDVLSAMEEYGKEMYNQAIDDAIKYGQVRCTTNISSVTASIYGTVAGESFKVDEQTLQKLKKQ